jgi:putative endonuclease
MAHDLGKPDTGEPDLSKKALGAYGETRVARWYEAQGYEVLARNWRCPVGELDLVLGRGQLVVFCEVKTRSSDRFGVPAEAVTITKQRRIRRLAMAWIDEARVRPRELRFDVASVLSREIEVIEAAF